MYACPYSIGPSNTFGSQNTRNTYDSSMIIPLCSMYQRHRGIHCFGQAGIASLEIFICTGRDSQLRHCLKLMPNNNLYPVRIRNWKLKILRFIRRFDQKSCFIIRVKFYQNIVASNPYIDSWISRYPFQFRNSKFLSFHSSRYFLETPIFVISLENNERFRTERLRKKFLFS